MSPPTIERLHVTSEARRHHTPLLFLHGMWHGAWCWRQWQEWFGEWGWESVAFSLPGHGGSAVQRPVRWYTLGYYYRFLRAEIERFPEPPVLVGHSVGGALAQWHLKYGDVLPATVLVAPWTSHNMWPTAFRYVPALDPAGFLLCLLTLSATPLIRTPSRAARLFLTADALLSPTELRAALGPESLWPVLQYSPLTWKPAKRANQPLLWLAADGDTLIPEPAQRRSAAHYGADYLVAQGGHDLMLERSSEQTARRIHDWLVERGL